MRRKADLLERSDLVRLGGAAGASAALRSGNWLQRINIRIRKSYTGSVCLLSIAQLWYAFAQLFEQYQCARRAMTNGDVPASDRTPGLSGLLAHVHLARRAT